MKLPLLLKPQLLATALGFLGAAHAADVTWDTDPGTVGSGNGTVTGGAGTWNTTNGNWTVDAGVNNIAWNNTNGDLALFTDTGDTATLGSAVTAQGLKFINAGHTVEGAGNTITLAGNGDDRIGDSPGPSLSLDNGGTVTINANINNDGKLLTIVGDRSGGRNIVVSGVISGSGGLSTFETVTATLSGANTYTGQTKVNAATTSGSTLIVSSLNSVSSPPQMPSSSLGVPADAAAGTIEIGNTGKQASCTLIYTGPGETTDRVIAYRMNGSPRNYKIENNGTGLLKFTSKPTKAGASTGNTVLAGSADGEFELGLPSNFNLIRKEGAGTWTLGGTSEPQGTTVTSGTLVITGTVDNTPGSNTSGVVTVSGGSSTLTVDGTLKFVSATVSGGTLDGSGTLSFDIDGTTSDQVTMSSGTIDISGMSVEIVPGGGSGLTEAEYVLIDATGSGTLTGTFTGFAGTAPTGYTLDYGTVNQVKLVSAGGTSAFNTWAASNGVPADSEGADSDTGGLNNLGEFGLGGNPTDGNDDGSLLHAFSDEVVGGGAEEGILTILVRSGASFTDGAPAVSTAVDGIVYTVSADSTLPVGGSVTVTGTAAVTTGLPAAPAGYEYASFYISGPEGYFQVTVAPE